MRRGLLIWACCIVLMSCKSKDKIPDEVLPKEKMEAVLHDMMRADQFLTDFVLSKDTSLNKDKESIRFYEQVFSIHQVSKEEFQRSFAFYRSHPQLMKSIMDSIGIRPVNPSTPTGTVPQPVPAPDTPKKKFIRPSGAN